MRPRLESRWNLDGVPEALFKTHHIAEIAGELPRSGETRFAHRENALQLAV